MKKEKLLRVKMMDRRGICGELKEVTYVANKKFCENYGVAFEGRNRNEIKHDLENAFSEMRIPYIEIL